MSGSTVKQKVLEALQQLPPDATVEDAIEPLYFLAKVERGVAQADAAETLPHEAARGRDHSSLHCQGFSPPTTRLEGDRAEILTVIHATRLLRDLGDAGGR